MADYTRLVTAQQALADPATSAADLALIAQHQPTLRTAVAQHPAAYPALLDWLAALGDPAVAAAVANRRLHDAGPTAAPPDASLPDAVPPTVNVATASTAPPNPSPWPAAQTYGAPSQGFPSAASGSYQAPPALPTQTWVGYAVPPTAPKKKRRWPLAVVAAILVVALSVTAVATRGFGLMPTGAATPEEAALSFANKLVGAFNSLSPQGVLSNPAVLLDPLSNDLSPAEQALTSTIGPPTTVDPIELLALQPNTLSLLADVVGSFHIEATGLEASSLPVMDGVAKVSYTGGTITVTADTDKLRQILPTAPATASSQLTATLAKYGVTLADDPLAEAFGPDWAEEAMHDIELHFPYTIDLSQTAATDDLSARTFVMTVQENNRWYVSSLLTGAEQQYGRNAANRSATPLPVVTPERHDTPTDAAEGFARALGLVGHGTSLDALAAEFPLPERRYLALYGDEFTGSLPSDSDVSVDEARFSESGSDGTHTRLRVDHLTFTETPSMGDPSVLEIRDGTCIDLTEGGGLYSPPTTTQGCLKDVLSEAGIRQALSPLLASPLYDVFVSAAADEGIDLGDPGPRLEEAAVAMAAAIDPDTIGLVTVKDGEGWHISMTSTVTDWQSLLAPALVAGLQALAVR